MFELKKIRRESISKARDRVERYRLLNQPRVAESICYDILEVDPENQEALVGLVLALTDQFELEVNKGINSALEFIPRLSGEYTRDYYTGLVHERQGKARLVRDYPGARFDAFELFSRAMEWYAKAEALRGPDDDDAILHWNSCARMIVNNKLEARPTGGEPVGSE